ncbi:hypothetical protein VKT23_018077 [Stygiomarasmius scandens]|uniref:Uncharacterized protein n=1 Tax=Marasmiellus scandens TaxID=2682957 RepID=A0ABR1ITB9_9AGAR
MTADYDYEHNVYIAVTLDPTSSLFSNPSVLSNIHSALMYVGPVGKLKDVHLVSFGKEEWNEHVEEIIQLIKGCEGINKVDVQEVKHLTKRNDDEL